MLDDSESDDEPELEVIEDEVVVVLGGTAEYGVIEIGSEMVMGACLMEPQVNWVILPL